VITTPVPTVALLAAARAMTQPVPPADLGLYRAVRESQLPPGLSSEEPPPSSERRPSSEGHLLESEDFDFELTPRSVRSSRSAPPLAEELGLDHLIADFKPSRSWSLWFSALGMWLRAYGVWVVGALLVLWLVISFAASWLPG